MQEKQLFRRTTASTSTIAPHIVLDAICIAISVILFITITNTSDQNELRNYLIAIFIVVSLGTLIYSYYVLAALFISTPLKLTDPAQHFNPKNYWTVKDVNDAFGTNLETTTAHPSTVPIQKGTRFSVISATGLSRMNWLKNGGNQMEFNDVPGEDSMYLSSVFYSPKDIECTKYTFANGIVVYALQSRGEKADALVVTVHTKPEAIVSPSRFIRIRA